MAKQNDPLLTKQELEEIDRKNSELVGLMIARSTSTPKILSASEELPLSQSRAEKEKSRKRDNLPLLTKQELQEIDRNNSELVGLMVARSAERGQTR